MIIRWRLDGRPWRMLKGTALFARTLVLLYAAQVEIRQKGKWVPLSL
jgi:hypothetical protein